MASANPTFDAIASSTRAYYANGKFAQQVYNGRPFLKWINSNGRVQTWEGGVPILEPLLTDTNSTFQWAAAFSEVDFTPQDGLSAAQFSPKGSNISVVMDWYTRWQNNGSAKVIDIWDTKMNQAKESFSDGLDNAVINGDGTDVNAILGLKVMVSNAGTYGGINRATNPFWQSYVEGTAGPLNEDDIRTGFYTVGRNIPDENPDLMLTTQPLYQKYEQMVLPAYRTQSLKVGDLGIGSIQWRGVDIMWTGNVGAGLWYFLNSKHIKLRPHSQANMDMTEQRSPQKQLMDGLFIYWYGSLTTNGSRYMGVLSGRTA